MDYTTILIELAKHSTSSFAQIQKRLQYSIKSHLIINDNMEIDDRFAKEHIRKWIRAWNDHNLREVISLYSESISFSSPKIKSVYPNRDSSTITNKKDLEEYFSSGLTKFPMLHFTPIDYFLKNYKVVLEYNATPDKKIQWSVIEKFTFDNDALIEKSSVYYGAEDWMGNSRLY